jgi:hypothetical protein
MRRALLAVTLLFAVGGAYAAGAFGRSSPSLGTDLRLTRHFACLDRNRHAVDRRTLRRFHAVISSVASLQRYYERPDEPNVPKKGVMCSGVAYGFAIPAFADAQAHWVTPARWPRDRCGDPAGFPPNVHWHVVRVRRVRQLISAPAVAANCPMKVGNTVAYAGPPHNTRAGTPLFVDHIPRTVGICIYRTTADNLAVGRFVRGFHLSAARTRRLFKVINGPGPKRGCPKQRNFAALRVGPRIPEAEVELGGCSRVERPDRTAGTANPAVVRAILAVR